MSATTLLLLADTHLGPGQADRPLTRIDGALRGIDVLVHAGDIVDASVLEALRERAPHAELLAVLGNNDVGRLDLPTRIETDVAGCRVGVVHDSGGAAGRTRRLRRWFPACGLVVFGHSHLPWHEVDVSGGHEQHHVNPGSAILRRRAPACTVARVTISDGAVTGVAHVTVD